MHMLRRSRNLLANRDTFVSNSFEFQEGKRLSVRLEAGHVLIQEIVRMTHCFIYSKALAQLGRYLEPGLCAPIEVDVELIGTVRHWHVRHVMPWAIDREWTG